MPLPDLRPGRLPRLSSIGAGDACKYCATKGLDLNAPAVIFVVTHQADGDPQVGFDSAEGEAITLLEQGGWSVFKAASVPTVEDAYEIKAAVLRWLTSEPGGHGAEEYWSTVSSELSRRRRHRRAAGGAGKAQVGLRVSVGVASHSSADSRSGNILMVMPRLVPAASHRPIVTAAVRSMGLMTAWRQFDGTPSDTA